MIAFFWEQVIGISDFLWQKGKTYFNIKQYNGFFFNVANMTI